MKTEKSSTVKNIFENTENTILEGIWIRAKKDRYQFFQWDRNGNLVVHSNWKKGELHGDYKKFSKGRLVTKAFFKHGNLHDEYKAWALDGNLTIHKLYRDGELEKDYLK